MTDDAPFSLVGALAIVGLGLASRDVHADDPPPPPRPIVILAHGPKKVNVRIAVGASSPCDAAGNEKIYEDAPAPGTTVTLQSSAECVCVEQTYEPFTELGWGASQQVCRPLICEGLGKARRCRPDPDPTIRIEVSSKEP